MRKPDAEPEKFHMRLPPEARGVVDQLQDREAMRLGFRPQRGELVLGILKESLAKRSGKA